VEQGLVLILSAPSGCGKTTIADRLLKRHPDWVRSISVTTREPRPGEKNGSDYFFLKDAQFQEMKEKGEFLEYANIYGQYYGTPKSYVLKNYENQTTVLLAIDIQGMKQVREALGDRYSLLTIFILPPSIKVLRERLEGRQTEKAEEIEKRMRVAEDEIKQATLYHDSVINQSLEQTVLEIDEIVNKFKKERE